MIPSVHQKCSNYTLTNLLFGLCRSMWIIDMLVTRLSPHPGVLAPLPLKCCKLGSVPQLLILHCFHIRIIVEFIRELGGASKWINDMNDDQWTSLNLLYGCTWKQHHASNGKFSMVKLGVELEWKVHVMRWEHMWNSMNVIIITWLNLFEIWNPQWMWNSSCCPC
jgi:hypothetical protein